MKKITFLKSLLVAACMMVGSSAWGAGYTRTLTNALEVSGYKAKAFYNFQKNDPEVLPTSGDLRYRDGNVWGLHNYASGTRSATATIPVAKGDILVIQEYSSSYVTTINRGSENSSLTASTGYRVFSISTTADDITFTTPRNGGIVAALVMEVDESATTANYTINYKDGETIVKTVSGENVAIGTTIYIESSFFKDDVKYVTDGGQISSFNVADGTNVYNIEVSEAASYSYTVNATDGTNILKLLASGSIYAGEQVLVAYPQYCNVDGTLYKKDATSSQYRQNVTISTNAQVTNFVYSSANISNVLYHSEGEEIAGATATSAGGNMPIRSSNAKCGYTTSDLTLINLPAGKYKITGVMYSNSSAGATLHFLLGDEAYDPNVSGSSNWYGFSKEFTLLSAADVKWLTSGDSKNGLDYVYIQKIAEPISVTADGYATLCPNVNLDFTSATAIEACKASVTTGGVITLTKVNTVKAGEGVLLRSVSGGAANEDIPVIASADANADNAFVGIPAKIQLAQSTETGYTNYILSKKSDVMGFYKVNAAGSWCKAGSAYLKVEDGLAPARGFFALDEEETTGICDKRIVKIDESANATVFDLQGRRVAQPRKGLYINNGRKVVVK